MGLLGARPGAESTARACAGVVDGPLGFFRYQAGVDGRARGQALGGSRDHLGLEVGDVARAVPEPQAHEGYEWLYVLAG